MTPLEGLGKHGPKSAVTLILSLVRPHSLKKKQRNSKERNGGAKVAEGPKGYHEKVCQPLQPLIWTLDEIWIFQYLQMVTKIGNQISGHIQNVLVDVYMFTLSIFN